MKVAQIVEELVRFGFFHNMIESLDIPLVRNQLLDLFKVSEPYSGELSSKIDDYPTRLLNQLIDAGVESQIIEDDQSSRDILDAKIMANLMPRQSELNRIYQGIRDADGAEAATDYYYRLSKSSNYIRTDRISKNKYWKSDTKSGVLEITINLSKPEKDPKDIEKAKNMPQSNYPKCLLCKENVGYAGRANYPARSNHRVILLTLNGEEWYLQYSPYVYYNEHAIIFKGAHEPMKITKDSFRRLTDFIEIMPHYFIGSNADLPIVGGSILSHDHFQGGHHRFPMVDAKVLKKFKLPNSPNVGVSMIKWPLSVIRLSSKNSEELVQVAFDIFTKWQDYSDSTLDILSFSEIDGERVPHNTITPISRMNDNNEFEIDLVLRNNRRSKEHPDGIFHPHKHLHHIKKENIGLIEVMGLAVLPPRLDMDMELLCDVLDGSKDLSFVESEFPHHLEWFNSLIKNEFLPLTRANALKLLENGVGNRFSEVLECAGVYKMTPKGIKGFENFIHSLGCVDN